jgi:hypothetical protein
MQTTILIMERLPVIALVVLLICILRAYIDAWCIQCWYKRQIEHALDVDQPPALSSFQKILNLILFLPKI